MPPIIEVKNLGKKYNIGERQGYVALRDVLANIAKSPARWFGGKVKSALGQAEANEFWALKDVNFEVKQGEVLGIIGRNGAGKSTLLKILSQITPPTTGEIKIRGRVGSLLEVGTGFHPELTGRENIYLNGAILGMRKKEIERKFDEIVEFAGIGKFLDMPVKRYSSGMYVRLAFSVAAHLEPDILVIDEVLAVGDAEFQKKCLGKMEDVTKKDGRTVLFVSHNMSAIQGLCQKCILLHEGKIINYGETQEIVDAYLQRSFVSDNNIVEKNFKEDATKEFQILSVRLLNESGQLASIFECDQSITIELSCESRVSLPGLYGYLALSNQEGTVVMVSDTFDFPPNCLDNLSTGNYKMRIKIPPRTIGHGDYTVLLSLTSSHSLKNFIVDYHHTICSFHLDDTNTARGNQRPGYLSSLLKWEINKI